MGRRGKAQKKREKRREAAINSLTASQSVLNLSTVNDLIFSSSESEISSFQGNLEIIDISN